MKALPGDRQAGFDCTLPVESGSTVALAVKEPSWLTRSVRSDTELEGWVAQLYKFQDGSLCEQVDYWTNNSAVWSATFVFDIERAEVSWCDID